jgi:hypothetical protein
MDCPVFLLSAPRLRVSAPQRHALRKNAIAIGRGGAIYERSLFCREASRLGWFLGREWAGLPLLYRSKIWAVPAIIGVCLTEVPLL